MRGAANNPYRADGHDVIFQTFRGGAPDSEHAIARCDDEMWAVHLADAANLKARHWSGQTNTMRIDCDAIRAATRAMCRELYGDDFDLHDHGAQDPEGRANLECAAEAAIEAYLEGVIGGQR